MTLLGFRATVLLAAASLLGLVPVPLSAAAGPAVTITPYTVPSSVVGSLDSAPASVRAAAMQGTLRTTGTGLSVLTRTPAPLVTAAGASGVLTTAGAGWFIGFDGTTAVLRLAGVPVQDTGYQGLMQAVNGPMEVNEAYTADADWTPSASTGWVPSDTVVLGGVMLGLTASTSGPWGANPGTVSLRADNLGGPLPRYDQALRPNWAAYRNFTDPNFPRAGTGRVEGGGNGSFAVSQIWPGPWVIYNNQPFSSTEVPYSFHFEKFEFSSPEGVRLATFFPPGHPSRPAVETVPPLRTWQLKYRCSTAPGTELLATSAPFREGDADVPPPPDARCASGHVVSAELWQIVPAKRALDRLIDSWAPGAALADWWTQFPHCIDGSCALELLRIDPSTGQAVSCLSDPYACTRWVQDPDRSAKYRCQYAGQVLPLSACFAYGPPIDTAAGLVPKDAAGQDVVDALPAGDPVTGGAVPRESYPRDTQIRSVVNPIPSNLIDQVYDVDELAAQIANRYQLTRAPGAQFKDPSWALPIARQCLHAASAAGLDAWDECTGKPIFISGRNVAEATDHDIEALTGMVRDPGATTGYSVSGRPGYTLSPAASAAPPQVPPAASYVPTVGSWFNPGWVAQSWEGGETTGKPNKEWYANHPDCVGRSIEINCDEFPMFATEQGGKPAQPTPHLRLVPATPNQRQGGFLGSNRCGLERGQLPPDRTVANATGGGDFLFVPIPETDAPVNFTGWICLEETT